MLTALFLLLRKKQSLGVLSRDDKGQLVVALSKKVHAPFGALEIEAKALKQVFFAKDLGTHEFIIEDDSLTVSQALAEKTSPLHRWPQLYMTSFHLYTIFIELIFLM